MHDSPVCAVTSTPRKNNEFEKFQLQIAQSLRICTPEKLSCKILCALGALGVRPAHTIND